ncbi:hypothetical protein ACNOHN_23155 [Bacteroides zhangwenhongii]|uniref:hypothetical protein n=1 Tax=Bacteroides zhangwenhongii TaxID=2650157 RepID=UPI003AB0003B
MGKFLLILGRGVGQVMFQNNALSGALLWETRHGAGGDAVFSVLLSVFLQLLGMNVGITTLTAPFVLSVWITIGIRYLLLTLFPAKQKVA